MADIPNPEVAPKAHDRLYVDRVLAPGFVRDLRVRRSAKLDEHDGPGENGASLTDQGTKLARVTIVLEILTRSKNHWPRLGPFVEALNRKQRISYAFAHPILALHGLSSLYVEDFEGPSKVEPGIYHLTLNCVEVAGQASTSVSAPSTTKKVLTADGSALFPGGGAVPSGSTLPAGYQPPPPPSTLTLPKP